MQHAGQALSAHPPRHIHLRAHWNHLLHFFKVGSVSVMTDVQRTDIQWSQEVRFTPPFVRLKIRERHKSLHVLLFEALAQRWF